MSQGLIGKKIGMTQVFTDEGNLVPVTVIDASTCAVVGKRTQEKLAKMPAAGQSQIELVRQRIAHEYETFHAAVAEWAKVKEQWLEEKARAVIEHWEHASFQEQLREIERRLQMQRRRLRVLHAQLA